MSFNSGRHESGLRATAVASLAMIALLGACAPKPVEREFSKVRYEFGPLQEQAELSDAEVQQKTASASPSLALKGEIESGRFFRITENLLQLSRTNLKPELERVSSRLEREFYSAPGLTTQLPFTSSPYISAAIGETKASTTELINDTRKMLAESEKQIMKILTDKGRGLAWKPAREGVKAVIDGIRSYLKSVLAEVERSPGIDPRVSRTLRTRIENETFPQLDNAELEAGRILEETRPILLLGHFTVFIDKNGIELDAATNDRLIKSLRAVGALDRMTSAQDGLSVLIQFWELTPPERREAVYKPVSEELYNYLKGRSPSQLNCLKDPDCHSIFTYLAKQIKILPALRSYGIDKLKQDMSESVRATLLDELYAQTDQAVRDLPQIVADQLHTEIGVQDKIIAKISTDYPQFVRGIATRFASDFMGGADLPGLEAGSVTVELAPGVKSRVFAARPEKGVVQTGAEALGSALALSAARLDGKPMIEERAPFMRNLVAQVNKMLALGGFKTEDGMPFDSLAITVDPSMLLRHAYLRTFASNPLSFAVPDSFKVGPGFRANVEESRRFGVAAQAELLRGLSGMIRHLRDWEKGVFDETLGNVTIGALVTDLPSDAVTEKFFPKDLLFAMGVGNAAVILQNMTKDLSSVLLLDQQMRISWSNELEIGSGTVASMAAMVDIEAGQRGDCVRSADVARFLNAVLDFLDATTGIELTKAGPLLGENAPAGEKRPLELLIDARRRLKLLVVGLANFLSHQMQDKDGGIHPLFSRSAGVTVAGKKRQLLDQALSLQALSRAGDYLGTDVYRWAAMDVFSFMTRQLWDPSLGFFRAEEGSAVAPDLEALTTTLLAVDGLKSKMTETNRMHWTKISTTWLAALAKL